MTINELIHIPRYVERFHNSYTPVTESGCWIWTGIMTSAGYGFFRTTNNSFYAHRVSYALRHGSIPDWKPGHVEIDHLCRVKLCVNPDHLELVPYIVNIMRSNSIQANNARRTICIHGHVFSISNTGYSTRKNGSVLRYCRECKKMRCRAYQAKLKTMRGRL